MSSPAPRPPHPLRLRWHVLVHRRFLRPRAVLRGHHNRNVVVALRGPLAALAGRPPGEPAKFRTPHPRPLTVIPRLWPDEGAVLDAVRRHLPHVPVRLLASGRHALHSYVPGTVLDDAAPAPEPLGELTLREITELFGALAAVPLADLPPLPPDWPLSGDSGGFLRTLARFAKTEVYARNVPRFGALFHDLGVPPDAMDRFHEGTEALEERPFRLLHSDVHRANLVRRPDGGLTLVDWENALFGDPLHELATHVVRMGYGEAERARLIDLWEERFGFGTKKDLAVYRDFEHAQSVYPDTMRAARALPRRPTDEDFAAARTRVSVALSRARAPLALESVPDDSEVEEALRAWHATDRGGPFGRRSVRGTWARR